MGEQGGLYLTSGLKHSLRKGKGRSGMKRNAFRVQGEIKATLYLPRLGLARGLHLSSRALPGEEEKMLPIFICPRWRFASGNHDC